MKNTFSLISYSLFISAFLCASSVGANTPVEESKAFLLPPLSFVSNIPSPPVPDLIQIGAAQSYDYTLENNTFYENMDVTASITGDPSGDAVIDPASDCLTAPLAPSATCTLTVDINPTERDPAEFVVSVNYTGSNFADVTASISYYAGNTYVYIPNSGDDTVSYCLESTAGDLDACTDSGMGAAFSVPVDVVMPTQEFFGSYYAYVSNFGSDNIEKCNVDVLTGEFLSCADSGVGTIFSAPTSVRFNTSDETLYAYITSADAVTACSVNESNGEFYGCVDAMGAPIANPAEITFHTFAGTTYAYISANYTGPHGAITRCTLDSGTGALIDCINVASNVFVSPKGHAFYTANNLHLYVADDGFGAGSGTVVKCDVDAMGNIDDGSCIDAVTLGTNTLNSPVDISFATISSVDYAFVTNHGDNSVSICSISFDSGADDGMLDCTDNTPVNFFMTNPTTSINTIDDVSYLYLTGFLDGEVATCKISGSGEVYCVDSGVGDIFDGPFPAVFDINADGNTYAYVSNNQGSPPSISFCLVDLGTGRFTSCSDAGPLGFNGPNSITFGTVDSISYAYVTDEYLGVFQCEVNFGGALSDCRDAGVNLDTQPYELATGIRFKTISGTSYLYIVDRVSEIVFQCALDATTGLMTDCIDSGATLDTPIGSITFNTLDETGLEYAYFPGQDGIVQCVLNPSNGSFSSCTNNTMPLTSYTISFHQTEDTEEDLYAYISLDQGAYFFVARCEVDPLDGSINASSCRTPFGNPLGIALKDTTGAGLRAYIAQNDAGGGLVNCSANSSFLSSCIDAGGADLIQAPIVMDFQTIAGTTYAYVADASNQIIQCVWDDVSGMLSACNALPYTFALPTGISFQTVSGTVYAYVINANAGTISQCEVDNVDGSFVSCSNTGASAFAGSSFLDFQNNFAYLTSQSRVGVCALSSSGLLDNCVDSGQGDIFTIPSGIAFFTSGEGDLNAYVTNNFSTVDTVTLCLINTNPSDPLFGTFTSCTDSGVGAAFDMPYGITFQSYLDTSYGYIVNENADTVSKCTLNNDGTFDTCSDSGAGAAFDLPSGIYAVTP